MNRVCFTGKIRSITDITKSKSGSDILKFTMLVSDGNPGSREAEPVISCYGEAARAVYGKLKENNEIYFEGTYHTGKYGSYITPNKIERMLGNRVLPEEVMIGETKRELEIE